MTMTPAQERLEQAAIAAWLRLGGLDAALAALAARLERVVRATDWQARSAQAFHEEAARRHAALRELRDRVGVIRAETADIRVRAAMGLP